LIAQENTGLYALIVAKLSICFAMMNMNLIKKYMYALSADKKKQKARLQGVLMHDKIRDIIFKLKFLAVNMREVANLIEDCESFDKPMKEKACELRGAASIALNWKEAIEKKLKEDTNK